MCTGRGSGDRARLTPRSDNWRFDEWDSVDVFIESVKSTRCVYFPAELVPVTQPLPRLLVIRPASDARGKHFIAGCGRRERLGDVAYVSSDLAGKLGLQTDGSTFPKIDVKKAEWLDVARHHRGVRLPLAISLLTGTVAVVSAVAALVAKKHHIDLILAFSILVLAAVLAVAKLWQEIRGASKIEC